MSQVFGAPLLTRQNTRFVLAEWRDAARVGRLFAITACSGRTRGRLDKRGDARPAIVADRRPVPCRSTSGVQFSAIRSWRNNPSPACPDSALAENLRAGANEIMKEIISRAL